MNLRCAWRLCCCWDPFTDPAHNGAPGIIAPFAHLGAGALAALATWLFHRWLVPTAAVLGVLAWTLTRLTWEDWHRQTGSLFHGSQFEDALVTGKPYTIDVVHWIATLVLTEAAALGPFVVRSLPLAAAWLATIYLAVVVLPQE